MFPSLHSSIHASQITDVQRARPVINFVERRPPRVRIALTSSTLAAFLIFYFSRMSVIWCVPGLVTMEFRESVALGPAGRLKSSFKNK